MKTLVVYKSVTGFTRDYAEAIAKALGGDALPLEKLSAKTAAGYDRVIFGGRLHMGMVSGLKKFRRRCPSPAALFAVGAMPAAMTDTIRETWKRNLTAEELEKVPHFYFQGGQRMEQLPPLDKFLIKSFASMLQKKGSKDPYEQEAARIMVSSFDCYSEDNILPLVEAVK